ncbi:hypothetical protein BaRGS_00005789 [Batillaria attramentaria]|uniref:Uncharacterized protein n=1 Tax=Batillaria attramentaria TaxID=370345 RepID=A0ABD0LVJ6_9CAEN
MHDTRMESCHTPCSLHLASQAQTAPRPGGQHSQPGENTHGRVEPDLGTRVHPTPAVGGLGRSGVSHLPLMSAGPVPRGRN